MDKRFVNKEFSQLKILMSFMSELLYTRDHFQDRLEYVQDGQKRMNKLITNVSGLIRDILATGPESQRKQLGNVTKDYKVELLPKLSQGSANIIMTKEQAKQLIDLAQEKCKTCVEDPQSAQKCALYQFLEVTAVPDSYNSLLCPYAKATWAD